MSTTLGTWPICIRLPVQWGEMDAFAHVNNVAFLRWFETGRIAYFERVGLLTLMERTGQGPILARTTIDYRLPLAWPDTVTVHATVARLGTTSFTMGYRVTSEAQGGAIAAEGEGVIVLVDYRGGGKVALPDDLRSAILALEGAS
jgi:acyl-CoA thioester hydrolase